MSEETKVVSDWVDDASGNAVAVRETPGGVAVKVNGYLVTEADALLARRIAALESALAERDLRIAELEDHLNGAEMSGEEGSELLNEATYAIAGLAEEALRPCSDPCVGHFGPKGWALYREGLDKYERMHAEEPAP